MFDEEESSAQQMKRSADVGETQGKPDLYDGSGGFLWKALPSAIEPVAVGPGIPMQMLR
jgi:hypothetical protein